MSAIQSCLIKKKEGVSPFIIFNEQVHSQAHAAIIYLMIIAPETAKHYANVQLFSIRLLFGNLKNVLNKSAIVQSK